ncbi:mitochondrial sodium/calcium exchanger protein-like isoform X1 [Hydractinia symbiolongicarpus]|uniref:mitochondrial sodium/calcium exchanger protein-like isoform X1 n=1 Tax=Hydractinia symbiolongicarpus TaxID=13093 RepID=UPI00254ED488|nr:mitochondrial sodium/calcium exchanger protein-like isoform X1 [Hydractinia symbiolongicarpus]
MMCKFPLVLYTLLVCGAICQDNFSSIKHTAFGTNSTKNIECSSYHKRTNNSNICHYVSTLPACQFDDGYIPYIIFPFCFFPESFYVGGYIIMFLWLMYMFIALGVTAEEFFCPCLKSISKTLRMSDSVAGVTLLALGNGAPDIFSVIAAVDNADEKTTAMAFQELFGAGIFVTTVVSGFINISASFKLARRPFIRDAIFYCAAVAWTFVIMYRRDINTAEAIGFIALYVIYAFIVIIGQCVNRRIRHQSASRKRLITVTEDDEVEHPNHVTHVIEDLNESAAFTSYNYSIDHAHMIKENLHAPSQSAQTVNVINEDLSDLAVNVHIGEVSLVERLIGIKSIDWKFQSIISKVFSIVKLPIIFLLSITSPIVDRDVQGEKWNKWLSCLQCLTAPVFCAFGINKYSVIIYKGFLLWHLLLVVGFVLMIVLYTTTLLNTPPRFHFMFAFAGFFVTVIWIKSLAQEIVNLLQSFGWIFGLTYGIMGLTFLAWGNSIGDFIANLTMAKHGAPRMAIAACYGGPLLNMLLGVGISCTISALSHNGHERLIHGRTQYIISAAFLGVSLLSALIFFPILKFKSTKYVGFYLIFVYFSYLVLSVLHETGIFHIR